jgi:hypothetical protein
VVKYSGSIDTPPSLGSSLAAPRGRPLPIAVRPDPIAVRPDPIALRAGAIGSLVRAALALGLSALDSRVRQTTAQQDMAA